MKKALLILLSVITMSVYAQDEQLINVDEWLSWKHDGKNTNGEVTALSRFEIWIHLLDVEGAIPVKKHETIPAPHNVEVETFNLVLNNIFFAVEDSGRYQIIIKVFDRSGFQSVPHEPVIVRWEPSFPTPITDIIIGPRQ